MVMESINVSPLRSTLQKEITDLKDSTIRYYKRKAHESIDSLLDFMAPKQGHLLKDEVLTKNRDTSLPTESAMIEDLSKLYMETVDNSLKMQILSVITNRLTKAELQTAIPGITIYRIDQARLHFNTSTNLGLQVKNKIKVPHQRMDDSKLEHAISCFFDTSFMQLVSYGTRDLKMDSGENITIPDVIRTTNHSKIIDLYFSYCTESNFEPLSKSTLFKILNTCAATKRTNLHGLDNIADEGIEGFESLKEITKHIYERSILSTEEHEQIQKNITSAKLYFKTDYKLHLEKDCLCADHCLQWLLSDPENCQFQSPCEHIHTLVCDRCEMLHGIEDDVFKCIGKMGDDDFKEDTTKNFQDALQKINDWKAHIARNVNQDLFRTQKLDNLKRFEGVLVMDWAMKFLPMRYREKQTDWFGQRGKHWHVSVCIYR
ncbi:uncharacterized protein LOC134692858 [Mytilus trossulus]|uniref:uncharacterized protein LOC134692858 n=1 Tax=Mytilus trossulus TaxID=6551 RepID=UPI0030072F2B